MMIDQSPAKPRRVSRDDLYAIVWQTPMTKLAAEFGISDNGLAKICRRLRVPYPPRGYWAKKVSGKQLATANLSPRPDHVPAWVNILPTQPKTVPTILTTAAAKEARSAVATVSSIDDLNTLHPKVKSWVIEHKAKQKGYEQERKKYPRGSGLWIGSLVEDLTERDLYRFRVTSTVFKAVERVGGSVKDCAIKGLVSFLIGSQTIECSIKEKMLKPNGSQERNEKWTAYPHHHNSGLWPSGFVRVTIVTYVDGRQLEWLETLKQKMNEFIPEIANAILGAGEYVEQRELKRAEERRLYEVETQRQLELRRQEELEEERWARFREKASDWEEHAKLIAFLAELRRRFHEEGDVEVGSRSVSQWIDWAQKKITDLDPLCGRLSDLFAQVNEKNTCRRRTVRACEDL